MRIFLIGGLLFYCSLSHAQSLLGKTISLEINRQRLDNVLEIISNKGNFYFSYNSSMVKQDSLVSFQAGNQTIRQILEKLFPDNFEFIESGNYVILRRKPITLKLVSSQDATQDRMYTITGRILDAETGNDISNASVYEKQQLSSALSNESGYFKLKLKSRYSTANLTISKAFYRDTTVNVQPKFNQNIMVAIFPIENEATIITVGPQGFTLPDTILFEVRKPSGTETYLYSRNTALTVEKKGIGKFLLSTKQRVQSLNIKNFFTNKLFQFSLVPKLSTHGKMNAQVINKFSFNLLGGYSGGVDVAEFGGIFNIDKKNVQYFQGAGVTNIVGGNVKGVQVAGISNTVLGDVNAAQFAGIANTVNRNMEGVQIGGIYNHVLGTMDGIQVSGITNFTKSLRGIQIAGIANIATKKTTGTQIAGIVNYTHKLKGVQIGLVNIADTLDGISIGLLNLSKNGYHKISIGTNEVFSINVALKTGNPKLYGIVLGSANLNSNSKAYSWGYGFGRENKLGRLFAVNTELTTQFIYLGVATYKATNNLTRAQANLNVKLARHFSIYAGPAYNLYYSNQSLPVEGYKYNLPGSMKAHDFGKNYSGWLGWSAGIHLF